MAEYAPIFQPGTSYTATTSATVTAGQLLEVSASGTVGPAGAGSTKVVGTAAFDAASGALVTVHRGGIQEWVSPAGVTAGNTLKAAAAGTVNAWVSGTDAADLIVGIALTTAGAGLKCQAFALR
jgi:hypothetical protein